LSFHQKGQCTFFSSCLELILQAETQKLDIHAIKNLVLVESQPRAMSMASLRKLFLSAGTKVIIPAHRIRIVRLELTRNEMKTVSPGLAFNAA
jgi:hypothetical protein